VKYKWWLKFVVLNAMIQSPVMLHGQGFALVEHFTSQGCSSCPPADKLLSRLSEETYSGIDNVFFLSMHVDYWNRLGLVDPYSSYAFINRQKNYAAVLANDQVYTPQMIVNGETSFVGSDEGMAIKL